VYLGYWAEGARADVLGATAAIRRTMADAGWVAGATMTKSLAVGMDGVTDAAACMTGGAVEATNTVLYTTVLASAARTYSAWVRRKTGTGVVRMTDNGGTNWTDITLTTTYQQFQLTRTQANPSVGFQIATNGDAIEVDFNTIEAATFANPTPIPVNVSKAADVLTYVVAGNFNNTIGSSYAEITSAKPDSADAIIIGDSTANITPLYHKSDGKLSYFDGANNTSLTTATLPTIPTTTVIKLASAWGGSSIVGAVSDTVSSAATFDGNMGLANIAIGVSGTAGNELFGSIRNVRIYNRQLSASQLAALTA
jgi:hypothetical protein